MIQPSGITKLASAQEEAQQLFALLTVMKCGIPETLVEAIKTLYIKSKSAVSVDGHLSEEFKVTARVLQRDDLALSFFIFMIDFLMKQSEGTHGFITAPRRSSRYPREVINDLDFADDIDLRENSLEGAQVQLNRTAAEAQKIGLFINTKKTEFITNTSFKKNLTQNNEDIKLANDFTYRGSKMASTNCDVKRHLSLAWPALWKLESPWLET